MQAWQYNRHVVPSPPLFYQPQGCLALTHSLDWQTVGDWHAGPCETTQQYIFFEYLATFQWFKEFRYLFT